ncbi:MAG: hypothetical protein EOO17_00855 [Chloroflexi bacterium]|nr:MAG: hypothetical protein EOO17_00855 [Chloroflexota bacterium]
MIDNELFKLCEDVYKRCPDWYMKGSNLHNPQAWWSIDGELMPQPADSHNLRWNQIVAPLYTSDYLLEMLPQYTDAKHRLTLQPVAELGRWAASYDDTNRKEDRHGVHSADTPLKALLKLCLALKDAGEL